MENAGDNCRFCEQPFLSEADAAACPHCQVLFHPVCLQDAGGVCAACGQVCETHNPSEENDPGASIDLPEGQFVRLKPSVGYRFSVMAVALGMVLLPLIILGWWRWSSLAW